jgi:nitronate monooxygenase
MVLAGMGGTSGPEPAGAVSNAGGLVGWAPLPPQPTSSTWITPARKLTDRPFGVDTLLAVSEPDPLEGARAKEGPARGDG